MKGKVYIFYCFVKISETFNQTGSHFLSYKWRSTTKLKDQIEASFIAANFPRQENILYSMKNEKYFITKERPQFSRKLEEKNVSY